MLRPVRATPCSIVCAALCIINADDDNDDDDDDFVPKLLLEHIGNITVN